MGIGHYTLDENHTPVQEPDLMAWTMWFQEADRTVAKTQVGHLLVSTVFLGLDHSFGFGSTPILFETMVFGDDEDCPMMEMDGVTERCSTWDEAVEQHERITNYVKGLTHEQAGSGTQG